MKARRPFSLALVIFLWLAAPLVALSQSDPQEPPSQEEQEPAPAPQSQQRYPPELTIQDGLIVARNQDLDDLIQALAEKSGLNVLFDSTFRSRKRNVQLRGLSPRLALDGILQANNLFAEPINDKTIIVALDNTANRFRLEPKITRTFHLKVANPSSVQMIQTAISALYGQRIMVVPNAELRALSIRTTPEYMKQVEDVLNAIDRPPETKNIAVTVYFLAASESVGEPLPPQLQGIVERFGAPFSTKRFRLLDTLFGRMRTGTRLESYIKGVAPARQPNSRESFYSVRFDSLQVSSGGGRQMIDVQMRVEGGIPIITTTPDQEGQAEKISYETTRLTVDASTPDGEPTVVGQASLFEPGTPVLVVLSARVIP